MSPKPEAAANKNDLPLRPLLLQEKPRFERLRREGVAVEAAAREARRLALLNDIAVASSVDALRDLLTRLTEEVFAK